MATTSPSTSDPAAERASVDYPEQGVGWLLFAGIMIGMVGVLNVIYGIAAIDNSSFFVNDARFILSDLNTWGWVVLIFGALQVTAAFSIWSGQSFGKWFGIIVATLNAIAALLVIQAYPFWSLAVFTVDLLVIYGLLAYGGNRRAAY